MTMRELTILKGNDAGRLPKGVAMLLLEEVDKGGPDFVGRPVGRLGELCGLGRHWPIAI